MTTVTNKKSWLRDKTKTGWSAFDLEQRRKQGGLESSNVADLEPFPSLSSSSAPKINSQLEKPFVSVMVQKDEYPSLISNRGKEKLDVSDKLKECYPWADKSLIEDILVGVDNDINEAASLLKVMELSNEGNIDENNSLLNCGGLTLENDSHQSKAYTNKQEEETFFDVDGFISEMLLFNGAESSSDYMSARFDSIPVEPEFEEDDVYLVHRRDALKVMRSASHHSKAASDAYLRGDHLLAQHHSSKAREEWKAAERLNAEAAKEILTTRNSKNDMWTLDLHGLHSAEAVEALQEHLLKIEFQTSLNQLSSSNRSNASNFNEGVKGREVPSQRSSTLHVITGKGNHSRGQAALPAAIRSFLIGNGYRFDDARPGVIEVRPKFRRG